MLSADYNPLGEGFSRFQELLIDPLRWKEPRRVFVCTNCDLFEDTGFDVIDELIYTMQRAKQHSYYMLSEYPARMVAYARSSPERLNLVARNKHVWWGVPVIDQASADSLIPWLLQVPAYHWLKVSGRASLARYVPHAYSFAPGGEGRCEDCGRFRYDGGLHLAETLTQIHECVIVSTGKTWEISLAAECRYAHIDWRMD